MCWKSLSFEIVLASNTLRYGINQEKDKEGPEPFAHAGASTQRWGVTLLQLTYLFFQKRIQSHNKNMSISG